jgi:hypothetical protein
MDLSAQLNTNIDTLPAFQDVPVTADRVFSMIGRLKYAYIVNSLGNVDDEKGMRWDVNLISEHVHSDNITGTYGGFAGRHADRRLRTLRSGGATTRAGPTGARPTRSRTSSSAASATTGWTRARSSATASRSASRASRSARSAGAVPEVDARRDLPPVRFSDVGTPANYLSWARPAVFAGALLVEPNQG